MPISTELVKENTQLKKVVEQKDQRIKQLEELLRLQRQKQFGASSEKDANQGQLFNEPEDLCDDSEKDEPKSPYRLILVKRKSALLSLWIFRVKM
jgi:hypothetical protein